MGEKVENLTEVVENLKGEVKNLTKVMGNLKEVVENLKEVGENFKLPFYIAHGIITAVLILFLILMIVLLVKINRLIKDNQGSNELNKQTNMMADFCYTNPTIVPGELLSRRGFSMYSGIDKLDNDFGKNKNIHYGTYHEARSKF